MRRRLLAQLVAVVFVSGQFGAAATSAGARDPVGIGAPTTPGARLWASRYDWRGNGDDHAHAIGVSPDGTKVFVTGESDPPDVPSDYATVAYDASTGARLWASRYDGPRNVDYDVATALGVSPDGTSVFVTGYSISIGGPRGSDYATVAYDAATGAELWARRYDGAGHGEDFGRALGVSPDGRTVFVTGRTLGGIEDHDDYVTIAYEASTGAALWVRRYDGGGSGDEAYALGVSPDGGTVFVTGRSDTASGTYDFATVAYNTSTGARLWASRYDGPGQSSDTGKALGVSPDGSTVFVAGQIAKGSVGSQDYATVALDASTGATLWVRRYDGLGHDFVSALAVSPDGTKVFVTGESYAPVRERLHFRHSGLRRLDRGRAVAEALRQAGQRRRQRPRPRGEPRRRHGVRDRSKLHAIREL